MLIKTKESAFPTAAEMLKVSTESAEAEDTRLLGYLATQIRMAAKKGETRIDSGCIICSVIQEKLESYGYRVVSYETVRDGEGLRLTRISWSGE